MAQRFGSDLVGVIGDGEDLQVTAVASKESSDNFRGMADFCDDQIAKMMNGQTGTSKNGQWTGTAEVHERILTEFTKARLKRIQDIVNYRLFPFLIYHGYKLKGYEFKFFALKDKKENTVDNKSYNQPNPSRDNDNDQQGVLNFFGHARNPKK